jgi:two-component system NtrC family sensor kinase
MRISTKLVVSLVIAVTIVMGFYLYRELEKERQALISQGKREIRVMARTLEVATRNAVRRDQWEDVRSLLREATAYPGVARVTLYKADGRPLVGGDQGPTAETPLSQEFQEVAKGNMPRSFFRLFDGHEAFHYLVPVRLFKRGPAVLEIVYLTSEIEKDYRRHRNEILAVGLAIVAAIAAAAWLLTKRHLSRPIQALIEGAEAIGAGDLTRRIPVARRDELGRLAEEFNRMTERLRQARDRIHDETSKKLELERQVQHSEKLAAVGRLAAGLAHEIGTPLNIVSGRAEYLLEEMRSTDAGAKDLTIIVEQIERIRTIIEQMLGYARVHPPHIVPTALPRVLGNVLSLLDHEVRRRGIQTELNIADGLPELAADPDLLQQVFVNLLLNSVDALSDGGRIRIVAEPWNGSVRMTVQDTGSGIHPEDLPRIFDPFFTTKKGREGTGLGLSVVYGIVRDHGGTIEVTSEVGAGTAFVVTLPAYLIDERPQEPAVEA